MSSGRDLDPAEASETYSGWADFVDCEFIGPLRPTEQAWADHALRTDSSAALRETVDYVIRRREAHIAALYRMAALLSLSGDLAGSGAASFRAVAESRALAEFMAASPAYCLDCFLLGGRCERHERGEGEPVDGRSAERGSESPSPEHADPGRPGAHSAGSGSVGSGSAGSNSGSTGGAPPPGHRDGQQPGQQPEWRRFGTDEFPSAGG